MSALAELQTIVAVHARGSSSSRFGAPLVLRPDGGVEIIEPSGPPLVVPAANVASYRPSTSGEVASPAKPPPPAGGVASSPVELSTGHVSVRTVDTDRASGIRVNPVVQKGRR